MKVSSRKVKGKRLEQKIAREWRIKTKDLAIRTPGSGSGKHKGDIYNRYFSIEAKNHEKVKLWEFWRQTVNQKHLAKPPVLMVSGNYRPILVCMDLADWLDLVIEAKYDGGK